MILSISSWEMRLSLGGLWVYRRHGRDFSMTEEMICSSLLTELGEMVCKQSFIHCFMSSLVRISSWISARGWRLNFSILIISHRAPLFVEDTSRAYLL